MGIQNPKSQGFWGLLIDKISAVFDIQPFEDVQFIKSPLSELQELRRVR